mmetsp:Transcript_4784/g.11942  ORF Transcript_4784/g.11942 Transcript_4784/m.11942 type:complete len:474 (+) Transcript_4784:74-1495(+)
MKISASLLLMHLLASFDPSSAIKCGTAISKDCVGDNDIRYDSDVGYDLKDHAPVLKAYEGLYKATNMVYAPDGSLFPFLPSGDELFAIPYTEFINVTISGSRYYQHNYGVFHNFDSSRPGGVLLVDVYYVATFEKDGTAQGLGAVPGLVQSDGTDIDPSILEGRKLTPLNERAWYSSYAVDSSTAVNQETWLCFDDDCTTFASSLENWEILPNGTNVQIGFLRYSGSKIESKDEWLAQLEQALDDANVPEDRLTASDVETGECATGSCPTEEQWQMNDPYFQESPYQEPDGSLKTGFIVGITIAGFVVFVSIAALIHRMGLARQERRIRTAVARAVASTMGKRRRAESLTPADLQKHFDSMDGDGDGHVTKAEVKAFLESSPVAELEDKDFEVLFATLDLNHDDMIDFTEFCAFFSIIRDDYDKAILQKSILQFRPSYIPSKSFSKSQVTKEPIVEEEEEEGEKNNGGDGAEA